MKRRFFNRRIVLAVVSLVVTGAFILNCTTMGYALRPKSAAEDEGRSAEMFGYGFASDPGTTLAHDKIFRVKAADAFTEGRAVQLFGHQAAKNLEAVAAEFLEKSGEVGISRKAVVDKLTKADKFLNDVFSAEFIEKVIAEIAKINEAQVASERALNFLRRIKRIAAIEDVELRQREARRAIVDETRFVTFIFGEKGLDPYLFNVGNILSKEYRALVAHIGGYPYEGSEDIEGGPRTIYTSLARIEGFRQHLNGIDLYREMMLHEFKDRAFGRHVDPSPKVIARLNDINAEIDRNYQNVTKQVATVITEEGSIIVTTPKVTIEKYRLVTDLGKKETFAIKGSSRVHRDIPKGEDLTITIAKADVGSIGGHGTAPGPMLEAVAEIWMQAAEQGYVLDFFITRVGDDISVTVTHNKGKDDTRIHKFIWDGFVNASVISKDLGYYGAGQDLLAEAFSGNVRGAGPSVAEMVIKEQASEVIIIGQSDKTAPGAFNQGLYEIFFGNDTTWRILGPGEAQEIKAGILDFDYEKHRGRHIWLGQEDYDAIAWYLGVPDRYTFDSIVSGKGEDVAAVTAQRLGIVAGKYVGKDDPMFIVRSQKRWPAVGEITLPFLKGDYLVPGWMRGSNKGPFLPVALTEAKIGIYDGPPLLSMWSFNVNNGRLVGFYDLMAANPAIRHIQDRRTATALRMLEQGFAPAGEMGLRLPETEIEYQEGPERLEERLKDRWEVFKEQKGAAEQQGADQVHEVVALQVAESQARAQRTALLQQTWGVELALFADAFAPDIYQRLSPEVVAISNKEAGKVYPILINHDSLLKASPEGIMALQGILEQLGDNIKFVLHISRSDIKPDEVEAIVDADLAKINQINAGFTKISRDMFAAVVVGTNPEEVAKQVQEKVGTDIYEVIGPKLYTYQFKDVIRVALGPSTKGNMALMAKALKLGLELIPSEGKLTNEDLKQLDELFSQDAQGNFHVQAGNVVASVETAADNYAKQVEAEVRI